MVISGNKWSSPMTSGAIAFVIMTLTGYPDATAGGTGGLRATPPGSPRLLRIAGDRFA
jgi:hypothetical protein